MSKLKNGLPLQYRHQSLLPCNYLSQCDIAFWSRLSVDREKHTKSGFSRDFLDVECMQAGACTHASAPLAKGETSLATPKNLTTKTFNQGQRMKGSRSGLSEQEVRNFCFGQLALAF
jgi:hypothetical protein